MIRNFVISILVTLAVVTGGLWLASWLSWMTAGWSMTGNRWVSYWIADGHFRASCCVVPNRQDFESIQRAEATRRKDYRNSKKPISSRIDLSEFLSLNFFAPIRSYWLHWREPLGEWLLGNWVPGQIRARVTIRDVTQIGFRLWPPCVLFAIYPTIAFIRGPFRRYRRRKRGDCVSCGYNLTGNKSGTCPECGRATDEVP